MKFVICNLILSYRDISHLFRPFASMTVCFVRHLLSSSKGALNQGVLFVLFVNMLSAQRRPYCALARYAVFHKLFCMKKDVFLPVFWRCKTIFVTLHHQTRAVMPGAAGTGAG